MSNRVRRAVVRAPIPTQRKTATRYIRGSILILEI
jgi:hypothetical protein